MNKDLVQRERLLRDQALFALSSDATLSRVSEMARIAEFEPGDYVCFQGDRQSPLVLVISGQLRSFTLSEDGCEIPICTINSGQSTGEPSIIHDSPLPENITAVRKSTVATLTRDHARQLFNEPEVSRALNNAMAIQLSHLVERYVTQGLPRAGARISAVIVSAINDAKKDESPLIELPNQATIAAMAKVSRETVSRVLKSLEYRGVIAKEGRQFRVRDCITLRSLATG